MVQDKAVQLKEAQPSATSHEAAGGKGLEGLPPRVRFMLETIYDLKNNKTR